MIARRMLLALLLTLTGTAAPSLAQTVLPPEVHAFNRIKDESGTLFAARDWKTLEDRANELLRHPQTVVDGAPNTYLFQTGLYEWMEAQDYEQTHLIEQAVAQYRKAYPASVFAPIADAMRLHIESWIIRGCAYAPRLSSEDWEAFYQLNTQAWKQLDALRGPSRQTPYWYYAALLIGSDARIPDARLTALLAEGLQKYPDHYPLYYPYIRRFTQRWGGDYGEMEQFITAHADRAGKAQRDTLYARLYSWMDQLENSSHAFLTDSPLDWERMRRGFEQLIARHPQSQWHQANLAKFACRLGDADTYRKWRPTLELTLFRMVPPTNIDAALCDEALLSKA